MKTKFMVTRKNFKNDNNLNFDLTLEILDLMGWNMENWFFQTEKGTVGKMRNLKKLK